MEIGIIGFQKSGKTTIFNALTGQEAAVSAYAQGKVEPNRAVVPVPDERLDRLSELFQPKKTTPATVTYIDLAGIERKEGEEGEGLGESQMHAIAQADALMAVIRGFENAAGDAPDIAADTEEIVLEMSLSDLNKVETRLERIEKQRLKVSGDEARRVAIEEEALKRIRPVLENEGAVRDVELSEEEDKQLRGFQFLTAKPLLIVVNAPEDLLGGDEDPTATIRGYADKPGVRATWMCGQTEMEIGRLEPEERAEFLADYGIEQPAAFRIIQESYALLGLISFLTVGPDECRAWTVREGATSPEAAGEIHTDLQRGFIRAEVCRWENLLEAGSIAELKKLGKLRLEGKNYIVRDGDVMNILFNV